MKNSDFAKGGINTGSFSISSMEVNTEEEKNGYVVFKLNIHGSAGCERGEVQRHLPRVRRRGRTAYPACWAMGTNEVE